MNSFTGIFQRFWEILRNIYFKEHLSLTAVDIQGRTNSPHFLGRVCLLFFVAKKYVRHVISAQILEVEILRGTMV